MKIVDLTQIKKEQEAIVREIQGGWGVRQRLNQMGIHPGDKLYVKRSSTMKSPVLIRIHGTEVAVGLGIAQKVMVSPVDEVDSG